jgi:hypothetical protein
MEIRYNGELIEKAVYVLRWTKRRKRERESRQTIWVLSYGDASGIQHLLKQLDVLFVAI